MSAYGEGRREKGGERRKKAILLTVNS